MADVTDFLAMNPEDIADTITLPEGSYDFVITSYRTDRVIVSAISSGFIAKKSVTSAIICLLS